MRKFILILSTIFLGCSSITRVELPGGIKGYEVRCTTVLDCETKTYNLCGERGYRIYEYIYNHASLEPVTLGEVVGCR